MNKTALFDLIKNRAPGMHPELRAVFADEILAITDAMTARENQTPRGLIPPLTITLRQAERLVEFFGGHDAEISIAKESPGLPAGLYAWCTECPEEGSAFLGATAVDDELAEKGRPGPAVQLAAVMKLADDYAHRYSFVEDDSMPRARAALLAALEGFLPKRLAELEADVARLNAIINEPHTDDFLKSVSIEAEHQRQRWGRAHDRSKSAENWFWLVGYLAGKVLRAAIAGDRPKALHHTISSAAALMNWYEAITTDTSGSGIGRDEDLKAKAA